MPSWWRWRPSRTPASSLRAERGTCAPSPPLLLLSWGSSSRCRRRRRRRLTHFFDSPWLPWSGCWSHLRWICTFVSSSRVPVVSSGCSMQWWGTQSGSQQGCAVSVSRLFLSPSLSPLLSFSSSGFVRDAIDSMHPRPSQGGRPTESLPKHLVPGQRFCAAAAPSSPVCPAVMVHV